jgi:hypothetical protein
VTEAKRALKDGARELCEDTYTADVTAAANNYLSRDALLQKPRLYSACDINF